MKYKAITNIDDNSNILNINSYNFENTRKDEDDKSLMIENKFKTINDSYESDEYRYWIEIYDYEEKKYKN